MNIITQRATEGAQRRKEKKREECAINIIGF
jgi:hypothetical protein